MTFRRSNTPFILLTISVGLLTLAAGISLWRLHVAHKSASLETLVLLPEPRTIADFALTDLHGKAFSLDGFKGHWSLLFFGYTSCPDVCPNTLYLLKQARQLMLQQRPADRIPLVYFVSVDPARDTAKKLADYLAYFDPQFIGLRGEDAQLKALTFQLGVVYFIEAHPENEVQYRVDHSASVMLLNPRGQLAGVFPALQDAGQVAHDVMTVIQ